MNSETRAEPPFNNCKHLNGGGGSGNPEVVPRKKELEIKNLNRYLTSIIKRIKIFFASLFILGPFSKAYFWLLYETTKQSALISDITKIQMSTERKTMSNERKMNNKKYAKLKS